MKTINKRTMLESLRFPVESLALLAEREGRRPMPIYQAHKWFARRFSSAFRAILIGSQISPRQDFWKAYKKGIDCFGKTVLDPFVGGGTSVVEASFLGANTIGIDVDPVACAITRFELNADTFSDLDVDLEILKTSVGNEVLKYYRTKSPAGEPRIILHAFWVQIVKCGSCKCIVEAHPTYQLAYQAEGKDQWVFCSTCNAIHRINKNRKTFTCKSCSSVTKIEAGTVQRGKIRCPRCSTEECLIDVAKRTNKPPTWKLFALETVPEKSQNSKVLLANREFQLATPFDRKVYSEAKAKLGKRGTASGWKFVPDRSIPSQDRADARLIKYGYQKYHELFNDRQLLHLSLLAEEISKLDDSKIKPLAFAFSDHLTTNCMLTHYAFGWRRLSPLFSIRAFRHVCRPVELNPWLDGTGRGTFPNTVNQVQRAIDYARKPYIALREGGFSETDLQQGCRSRGIVLNDDSRLLSNIDDSSVDIVLTDPPYCDNIAYSELSDFYLPWLQMLGIVDRRSVSRGRKGNLAAQTRSSDSVKGFQVDLGQCFTQMHRVLRKEGRLIFSFQHSTAEAWNALAIALYTSGFEAVQVLPLLGNSSAGLHQHEQTILWDAVIICKKSRPKICRDAPSVSIRAINEATKMHAYWTERLEASSNIQFRNSDSLNLFRALVSASFLGMFGSNRSHRNFSLKAALRSRTEV